MQTSEAGWKKGPLPPDIYNWGAIVLKKNCDEKGRPSGFWFANFNGKDTEVLIDDKWVKVDLEEVAYYNNSIEWNFPK